MSDDVVTKFPTTTTVIVAGWNNPTNAFVEDGVNTDSSTNNAEQKYGGWNFTTSDIPEGSTITKVEMGAKHYEVNPSGYYHYTQLKYVDSAGTPYTYTLTQRTSLTWDWVDITTKESSWDLTKLNNADVRIKMSEVAAEGGCYVETEDEKCYVICKENGKLKLKSISEIKPGDEVLICDYEDATAKKPNWMRFSKVLAVEVSELKQEEVVEIWSGEVDLSEKLKLKEPFIWKSHITVTKAQPIHVFNKESTARFVLTAEEIYNHLRDYPEVELYTKHLWHGFNVKPFRIWKATLKTVSGKAYNLKFKEKNASIFCKTLHKNELEKLERLGLSLEKQVELGPPFMAIAIKTTCYVDAVALRVTFTPPAVGQYYNLGDGLTQTVTFV